MGFNLGWLLKMNKTTYLIVGIVLVLLSCLYTHGENRYVDNGDGTITDTKTGLMWCQKDSFAETGQFMDWDQARAYMAKLHTGGYDDWRIPTIEQYKTIYDPSCSIDSCMSPKTGEITTLQLSPIFAKGASLWCWSSDEVGHNNVLVYTYHKGKQYKTPNIKDFGYIGAGIRAVRLATFDK